ncbi:MAG: outer membrane protein transport protein [Kofleriaceae bacterium]|nr:outer membrane protein transport protein [Kofleriaceae bacterium]MBP9166452.1 outer membrane protein transport protein [Kofleriaceae bacterium]MBP9860317.1 outer membrane protein transport protein [Kofleriaceae bacterium]
MRAALAAATLAATASVAAANPADAYGFGARGQAMAGAMVAGADDTSATYYNPALLAVDPRIRIDLGYQLALPRLTVDGRDVGVDASRGLAVGLAVPGQLLGARLAVGAGLFLPDQHITRTRTLASSQPRFALYDNRPQRLFLSANLAVRLPRGVYLGAGIAYMSSTQGTVALDGLVGFPDPGLSQLELAIDVDLKTIRYPHLGVAWEALPWLTLGAAYRGGFRLEIDQAFEITGDVGLPGSTPVVPDGSLYLRSRAQDLFQPAQLTVGAAARLTPRWTVDLDLAWHRWSAFDNPAARIDIVLDLGPFQDLVDIPPQEPLPAPHYHDIAVPRLGVEHRRGRTRWRAGYSYEPSPAPPQRGATNFIDNDKHTVALGAGLERAGLGGIILQPISLDLALALTWLPSRDHEKLIAADPVGDYRSAGAILTGAVTSRWRF